MYIKVCIRSDLYIIMIINTCGFVNVYLMATIYGYIRLSFYVMVIVASDILVVVLLYQGDLVSVGEPF